MPDTPDKSTSPEKDASASADTTPDKAGPTAEKDTDQSASPEAAEKKAPKRRRSRATKKSPAEADEAASEAPVEEPSIEQEPVAEQEPVIEIAVDETAVPTDDTGPDIEVTEEPASAEKPSETIEAATEPKIEAADIAPPPPPRRSSRGLVASSLGLLIAGAIGAAVWTYPWTGIVAPVGDTAAVAGLSEKVAALETRVGRLETAGRAEDAPSGDLAELQGKLTLLEQQIAALTTLPDLSPGISLETAPDAVPETGGAPITTPPDGETPTRQGGVPLARLSAALDLVAELEARMDQVEANTGAATQERLQAIEGMIAETDATGRLDAIEENLSEKASGGQLDGIEDRVARLESGNDARIIRAASLAMAVANLSRAASGPAPFAHELTVVRALAPDQPYLADLTNYAENGLPTIATLRSEFPAFGRAAIRADRSAGADGWWQSFVANFQSLINLRKLDETEGESTTALVARIENYLLDGQLSAALSSADRLTPAAAEAIAPWVARAAPRAEMEVAIANLNADVLAAIGISSAGD